MRLRRIFIQPLAGLLLISVSAGAGAFAQTLGPPPLPTGEFAAPALPTPKPKKIAAPVVHDQVVARNDKRPSFHPESLTAISAAAERYRAIADAGDWPILAKDAALKLGDDSDLVLMLRHRLAAEGDLAVSDTSSPVFDASLVQAVKRFQARHGHSQNGLVIGPTLAALQVSARARFTQLNESARRLAARNFAFGSRYVVVNIPSASVEAIENGIVEKRFVAVVGKKDRASPEVETRITNVNLNPTWTVPYSIVKKDIIPKMQKDPAYLSKAKIRIFGASGGEIDPAAIDWKTERALAFTLRQESGTANALGQIRIDMPNREAVYMHDTPTKRLFSRDDRFHSSGCVRVENVRDFALWLLDESRNGQTRNGEAKAAKSWDRPKIDKAIGEGKRQDIRLREPVPVIWTYLTGFVTPDGTVHFRPDVYGHDLGRVAAPDAPPQPQPQRKAKAAPVMFDSAALDARAAAAGGPIQQIDP